jgi:hypothetical protein
MLASCSSAIASVIRDPEQPAVVLGVAASALYLQARHLTLAVVTSDAVRLPCAVVLPVPAEMFSLRDVPPDGLVTIGGGALRWTSHSDPIELTVVREWQPASVVRVVPRADRVAELRARVAAVDIGVAAVLPSPVSLLGRGPGLTPSGDDVLAGYLLGCRAFGLAVPSLAGLHRTTALSSALLEYAAAGLCVPEVARLVAALGADAVLSDAVDALLRIGHTSGAALGAGVLLAADGAGAAAA